MNDLTGVSFTKNGMQVGSQSRIKVNSGMPGMIIGQVPMDEKRSNSVTSNLAYSSGLNLESGASSAANLHAGDHYQITQALYMQPKSVQISGVNSKYGTNTRNSLQGTQNKMASSSSTQYMNYTQPANKGAQSFPQMYGNYDHVLSSV